MSIIKNQFLHRREHIILTAIEIINELGIQGMTTKEIAVREGVSEGTLFRHFKNKNEITHAILDRFSQYDRGIMGTIQMKNMAFREAVRFFIASYAEYYQNYPAITSLVHAYDVLANEPDLLGKIGSIFHARAQFLMELIEERQKRGEIGSSIDGQGFEEIIEGTFRVVVLKWRMSQYSFPLKDRIMTDIDMILEAFLE